LLACDLSKTEVRFVFYEIKFNTAYTAESLSAVGGRKYGYAYRVRRREYHGYDQTGARPQWQAC
jgi:hypothetical protein